jgi:molybdopterin molybdotransferase
MIPYPEALSALLETTPHIGSEQVPIIKALGRVLREDIYSSYHIPPFTKATMDGYAVKSRDTARAKKERPILIDVIGDLPAGRVPGRTLRPGQAIRIMTGAPLPKGADAVVMVEDTEKAEGAVKIFRAVKRGDNIGKAGEDVRKGERVIARGTKIGPAEMGMLSACGKSRIRVSRIPRAAIIITGDEIVEPDRPMKPGQIRDANSYSLFGLCHQAGVSPELLGIAGDSKGRLEKKLEKAKQHELLILSGGVSMGDYDLVKDILKGCGVKPVFWKVAIKPGKPVFTGKRGRQVVFGLPGNPVSVMITFMLFVRPAIDKMTGRIPSGLPRGRATLTEGIKLKPGRRKFLRGMLHLERGKHYVKPYYDQHSGILNSMVKGDVLIDVPGTVNSLKKGQPVEIIFMES